MESCAVGNFLLPGSVIFRTAGKRSPNFVPGQEWSCHFTPAKAGDRCSVVRKDEELFTLVEKWRDLGHVTSTLLN